MAGTQLETFLRRLRGVLDPHGLQGVSDAHLLERFVQHRDEQAFELLVWRHGLIVPMSAGACWVTNKMSRTRSRLRFSR